MYLLVDSGSTKADWVIFSEHQEQFLHSSGINPSIQQTEYIQNQITIVQQSLDQKPDSIIFYGAGCQSSQSRKILYDCLAKLNEEASVEIHSDLLAAGRALCRGNKSIICILGTGSHAAICDGHEIIDQLPALGYLLGDEGSGNALGKEILKKYFYQLLDIELRTEFEFTFPLVKSDFIYQLYHTANPSSFLAQFGKFVVNHKDHPECRQIIIESLESFIKAKLIPYKEFKHLPVHSCGSIAYLLKNEFELTLRNHGFSPGNCIQKPIHALLEYHRKRLYHN